MTQALWYLAIAAGAVVAFLALETIAYVASRRARRKAKEDASRGRPNPP